MNIRLPKKMEQVIFETIGDGDGIRLILFFQSCPHFCEGCQNKSCWSKEGGISVEIDKLVEYIKSQYHEGFHSGITLSGGDPLYQREEITEFLRKLKDNIPSINVWCYTGYTYEDILSHPALSYIDVLVDGKYIKELPPVRFRGSNNQRIIDVKKGIDISEKYSN